MEYRTLGKTDIDVSVICLGTMTWGEQNTREQIILASKIAGPGAFYESAGSQDRVIPAGYHALR